MLPRSEPEEADERGAGQDRSLLGPVPIGVQSRFAPAFRSSTAFFGPKRARCFDQMAHLTTVTGTVRRHFTYLAPIPPI